MKKFFTFSFLLLTLFCFGQNQHLADSLEDQLRRHYATKKELNIKSGSLFDTTAANILFQLGSEFSKDNPDRADEYVKQGLTVAEETGYRKGVGKAYGLFGQSEYFRGNYEQAISFYRKEMEITSTLGDSARTARIHLLIGNVYYMKGNYPEALEFYFAGLKMKEQIGDIISTTNFYTNISLVYSTEENYQDAINILNHGISVLERTKDAKSIAVLKSWVGDNYGALGSHELAIRNKKESLKVFKELSDFKNVAAAYDVIAEEFFELGSYDSAMVYYTEELKYATEINSKSFIGAAYQGMGKVNFELSRFDDAIQNYLTAIKVFEGMKNKPDLCYAHIDLGKVYSGQKKFNLASATFNKALTLAKELGAIEQITAAYAQLLIVDSARADFKSAFRHRGLYIMFKDSLFSTEKSKKINMMQMHYDYDKKEAAAKAEQEKKDIQQRTIRNSITGILAGTLIFLVVVYRQRNKIARARRRSDELLLNILPGEVAEELKAKGSADAKQFEQVTVMFTDFKGFTQIAEKLSPAELVNEIDTCFKAFDNIIGHYGIEKIKTIGDSYMCAGGLPVANKTNATDVVNAAMEIQQFMQKHLQQRKNESKEVFEIRIGIHTGPVVAGIVGVKKYAYDIWGDTVNIAARMEQNSEAGKINISGTTYELVKSKFKCEHRGKISAKNKGEVDMYFVEKIL